MTISEKLSLLRCRMASEGLDGCLVVTDDFHGSEYVGNYFKTREYLSGFTGSAGTLLVLPGEAYLWTDGRYFLQAEAQLRNAPIQLMRQGRPGVPELADFLACTLPRGGTLGFDGRTVSTRLYRRLSSSLAVKNIRLNGDFDPAEGVWPDRPAMSAAPVYRLDGGVSRAEKLALLRQDMAKENGDHLLLSDLTDVAWTLDLRGNDVDCTPVFLAFLLLGTDCAHLCIQASAVPEDIRRELEADNITLHPYEAIYDLLRQVPAGARVLADGSTANSRAVQCLSHAEVVIIPSPAGLRKAAKTPAEQEGFRQAHLQDGAALCRFLHRLKTAPEGLTEVSAAALLQSLRRSQPDYIGDSFPAIVAYGAHGAVVHYEPSPETDVPLERRGLLLIDSGGHYRLGTTDVTRTAALGAVTEEERRAFTLVLQGNIDLSMARFPRGVMGENLEILARSPLWRRGMDYDHATGHGVGCVLSVHETPPSFRWRLLPGLAHPALEAGMVLSNEPGYYEAGKFGVRHENLVMVRPSAVGGEGFLELETLTLAPFDRDAIDPALLTEAERLWLDQYHRRVFELVSPLLERETAAWLAEVTRPL